MEMAPVKRVMLECEHCGRTVDDDDAVRYEGYLVHARCSIIDARKLSERRVREDEASRVMLAEAAR